MSLDKCLPDLERKGELDVGRSKEARELYDELRRFYERTHDPETAAALASEKTVERLEAAIAHKKRNLIRQMRAQQNAIEKMRVFNGADPAATGPLDPRGGEALLAWDSRAGHNDSVFARERSIHGAAHSMIADILHQHHRNLIGQIRNRAQLDDVVREIFKPGSTGSADAKAMAEAWLKAAEYLRSRYNDAGGQIGKLKYGYLPQSHSALLVRKAGYQTWRDFIAPLLDRSAMIDSHTGEPFTDQTFELAMREVWERIRTDGWSGIEPGQATGRMLANQHAEHRFLHFTDGDAWLKYQSQFGTGTAFDAMMGHIAAMSRDTALMEILGPNPAATMRWLKDAIVKSAQLDSEAGSKAIERAKGGVPKIQRLYDEFTGTLRRPENEKLALYFSAIRAFQSAAKLGSAVLSAVPTDPAFGMVTRRFNGMPVWKMFMGYARQLNPASAEDRLWALRAGLIAEEWSRTTAAQHRILNEEFAGEVPRVVAEGVLRVSGLAAFTQAGRWAFGMEFLAHLTNNAGKRFDELSGPLQRAFDRHGIGADTWDAIRNSPIEEHGGAGWLLPRNMDQSPGGSADKLLQLIHTEVNFAVPYADPRTRALMNSVAPRGTFFGEMLRSALLFKTFGITLMLTHWRRMLEQSPVNMARYAAAFFISTTLGGAMAMELKRLAGGQDPQLPPKPKDGALKNAQYWGSAALQGGGYGIYGDFLGATERDGGGSLGETLAGPMAESASNFGGLGFSGVRAALGDKTAHPGRDLVKTIKQETPGSNLWFSRVAFQRLVADQLQREIDPAHDGSWRSVQRKAAKQGQPFWWEPGETSPKRAPKIQPGGQNQ